MLNWGNKFLYWKPKIFATYTIFNYLIQSILQLERQKKLKFVNFVNFFSGTLFKITEYALTLILDIK